MTSKLISPCLILRLICYYTKICSIHRYYEMYLSIRMTIFEMIGNDSETTA